jgi:ATP synthase protein I
MDNGGKGARGFRDAMALASLGLEMGLCVALGYVIGDALDGWLGTGPWLMVAFVILGSVAGFRGLYRSWRKALKEDGN